jgi:hypothetical protein
MYPAKRRRSRPELQEGLMAGLVIVCGMGDVGYRIVELLHRLGETVPRTCARKASGSCGAAAIRRPIAGRRKKTGRWQPRRRSSPSSAEASRPRGARLRRPRRSRTRALNTFRPRPGLFPRNEEVLLAIDQDAYFGEARTPMSRLAATAASTILVVPKGASPLRTGSAGWITSLRRRSFFPVP